jgi:hypothetical protein
VSSKEVLMSCREQSPTAIFALHMGGTTQNIGMFVKEISSYASLKLGLSC